MLTQETFNAIINYLANKPYQEVQPLFNLIIKDMEKSDEYNKDTATEIVAEE